MKRAALFALGTALLVPTGLVHAQRISPLQTGNFARICSKPAGASICDAYITGVADAGALAKINDKNEGDAAAPAGFCVPTTETASVMRGKVVAWLKDHSDSLSKPVGESVFRALHDSYPCSAKK
ncbi:Rap1a/Tai family immunity protein [Acetobacter orientalis]|uniref:Rap1a/Tai family immunity protein n=1 Tax=Acetobacter orientalis TaxID=146474 RepID=UPI0039EC2CBF